MKSIKSILVLALTILVLLGNMSLLSLAAVPSSVTVDNNATDGTFTVAMSEKGTNLVITLTPVAGLVFDTSATDIEVDGVTAAVSYKTGGTKATITVAKATLGAEPDITGVALKTSAVGFKFYAAPFRSDDQTSGVLLTGVLTDSGTTGVISKITPLFHANSAEPSGATANGQNGWFSMLLTGAPSTTAKTVEYQISGVDFEYNGIPVTATFKSALKVAAPFAKTAGVYDPMGAAAPTVDEYPDENQGPEDSITTILYYFGTGGVQTAYGSGDWYDGWYIRAQPLGAQVWVSTQQFIDTDLTKVTYTFLNTTNEAIEGIKIAMDADVKIGNDDTAPILSIDGDSGFTMTNNKESDTENYGKVLAVINANPVRYNWWGKYSSRRGYLWDTTGPIVPEGVYDSEAVAKAQGINLAPGQLYQAVFYIGTGTATDIGSAVTDAIVESSDAAVESNYAANGTTLVVSPTDKAYWYAVVDATTGSDRGSVIGDWQQGTGGALNFEKLDPDGVYEIVRKKSDTKPADTSVNLDTMEDGDKSGELEIPKDSDITVPQVADVTRRPDPDYPETDRITITNTDSNLEYNLRNPETGEIMEDAWISGTGTGGDALIFGELDADVAWEIVVRTPASGSTSPSVPVIGPTLPPLIPRGNISGEVTTVDGQTSASVTINPANVDKEYAVVDADGNISEWVTPTQNPDESTWSATIPGLVPGASYTIITRNTGETNADSFGTTIVAPLAPASDENVSPAPGGIKITCPQNDDKQYAVIDPDTGEVISEWKTPGENGKIEFDNLDDLLQGKLYEIVSISGQDDPSSAIYHRPGTQVVTGFEKTVGGFVDANNATITISVTDSGYYYAIVDENGDITGDWKQGTNGPLTFDGLTPGSDYKIISLPSGATRPTEGLGNIPGVALTAPEEALVDADDFSVGSTSITVNPTDAKLEYSLRDASGNLITGSRGNEVWKKGNGGSITFSGLATGTQYQVVTRSSGDSGNELNGPTACTGFSNAQGSINSSTGKANVTLVGGPENQKYIALDTDGQRAAGPVSSTACTAILTGLNPGEAYTIVAVDNSGNNPSNAGQTIIAPIAPPAVAAGIGSVTIKNSATDVQYKIVDSNGTVMGWKDGTGSDLTLSPLAENAEYTVISRPKPAGVGIPVENHGTAFTTLGTPKSVTITYDLNGGNEKEALTPQTSYVNGSFPIPVYTGTKANHIFAGWTDGAAIYHFRDTYTVGQDNVTLTAVWTPVYTVSGIVKNQENSPVSGATVYLYPSTGGRYNNTVPSESDGTFTIDDSVPAGRYQVVVIDNQGSVTTTMIVIPGDADPGEYHVGTLLFYDNTDGTLDTVVDIDVPPSMENPVPSISVGGLEKTFEDDDIETAGLGGSVEIIFNGIQKDIVDPVIVEDLQVIESALINEDEVISIVLDLFVEKIVTVGDVTQPRILMHDTADIVEIYIALPQSLQGKTDYAVYRVHGSETATNQVRMQSPGSLSSEGYVIERNSNGIAVGITIFAKKFSTYAVTFSQDIIEDKKNEGPIIETPECTVTISQQTGGRVSVSSRYPQKGSTVTVTVTPDKGYIVTGLDIRDRNGNPIEHQKTGENTYSFVVPKGKITVTPMYKKLSELTPSAAFKQVSTLLDTDNHTAYMHGYTDGTFNPENSITRAETAQVFYNLLRNKDIAPTDAFSDVAGSAWYAKAVNAMAALGLLTGDSSNNFSPDKYMTRAEFVAVAVQIAGFVEGTPTSNPFTDVGSGHWAADYIGAAYSYGYILGVDSQNTRFLPDEYITRAEVVTIVNRMLARIPDANGIENYLSDLTSFPDVGQNKWYFNAITEAVTTHQYERIDGDMATEIWK